MMEPAEDWYRCDAADEDFFNSLLSPLTKNLPQLLRA